MYLAADIPKYQDIRLQDIPKDQLSRIQDEIRNNYVMAEVYFQTLNIVNITQTPLMDVS